MATLDKLSPKTPAVPGVTTVDPGATVVQGRSVQAPLVLPNTTQVVLPEAQDARATTGQSSALGLLARQQPKIGGKRQKAYDFKTITFDPAAIKALIGGLGPTVAQLQKLFGQDPTAFHAHAQLAFAGQEKVA